MATYKRIDGDYVITSINPQDDVIINTRKMTINGNLDVAGNLTYINVTELDIADPFIVLNASNTGAYAQDSGVLTHITSSLYAGIRYDNTTGKWQISSDTNAAGTGGAWANLVTGSGVTPPGGSNTNVQFNDNGSFAGTGNLTFDKSTNLLTVNGPQALGNVGSTPSTVANAVVMYNAVMGGGGTGLYVTSPAVTDELVSKTKAIIYGIIF